MLLNSGNVISRITTEIRIANRFTMADSVMSWPISCHRLDPEIFRMLISLMLSADLAMEKLM